MNVRDIPPVQPAPKVEPLLVRLGRPQSSEAAFQWGFLVGAGAWCATLIFAPIFLIMLAIIAAMLGAL